MALQSNSYLVLLNALLPVSPIFELRSQVAGFHLLIPLCTQFPHLLTFIQVPAFFVGCVSSGGIAICYELHVPGLEPRWKIFRTRTDRPWNPPGSSLPECKSAGAWRLPPFPIKLQDHGKSRAISLLPSWPNRVCSSYVALYLSPLRVLPSSRCWSAVNVTRMSDRARHVVVACSSKFQLWVALPKFSYIFSVLMWRKEQERDVT